MTVELYLAPTAAGKTAYVLDLARETARHLGAEVRLCLANTLQAAAARRRLAAAGGTIGVRVLSFEQLVLDCLNAAGEAYIPLSDPVQYRLIRAVIQELPLGYYAPLTAYPGFVQAVQELIHELKTALVRPAAFTAAASALGDEPRLGELAQIYAAYQKRLQDQGWVDYAGLTWLAGAILEQPSAPIGRDWPLLLVDGFDRFTPAQLSLLGQLAGRVGRLVITLTGSPGDGSPFRRFQDTRRQLEALFEVAAQPLPPTDARRSSVLHHLTSQVFRGPDAAPVEGGAAIDLLEAPDQAAEVRAALRWLKARLVLDGAAPGEIALLARDLAPYRERILQVAAEFGLPVRLVEGRSLTGSPVVAALVNLLRLMRPAPDGEGPALPPAQVAAAWRSPYFDWTAHTGPADPQPIGLTPEDADRLDAAARHGRVIVGYDQWLEALGALAAQEPPGDGEEAEGPVSKPPTGPEAAALLARLDRFRRRLTPPVGAASLRDFAGWLETLIGPDPAYEAAGRFPRPPDPTSLNVVAQVRAGPPAEAERDIAALRALKEVLRGLVWAEEAAGLRAAVDYPRFLSELLGAIEAATYHLPSSGDRGEILVANVAQARGLPFRAVAVAGLAEGIFPALIREDPFLRDADRQALRQTFALPLDLSTRSEEREIFYETLGRPWERLLLTRPRLDDNGAEWVPSPFWAEVRRLVTVTPMRPIGEHGLPPVEAASWPELLQSLAAAPDQAGAALRRWVAETAPERLDALGAAADVLGHRLERRLGIYDGRLSALAEHFALRFGPDRPWSASRLEAYRTCPHFFFAGSVLGLEPRAEPAAGLDARQLGTIYHRILEALYRDGRLAAETDEAQIQATVARTAGPILDAAPAREGFRATHWWEQTRAEIVDDISRSVLALNTLGGGYLPIRTEAYFDNLAIGDDEGGKPFQVRGFIDRVDRDPEGRLRIIDYKTGGPSSYDNRSLTDGRRLQLPLYALAAQVALGLGQAADGFYWHFRQARSSPLTLDGYPEGGVAGAVEKAVGYARLAVLGARQGDFAPRPPADGCPSYCPAAAYCWHYRPRRGG